MKTGRLPTALTLSIAVAALSLGTILLGWMWHDSTHRALPLALHGAAGVCLGWTITSFILHLLRVPETHGKFGADLQAVIHIAILTTALGTFIVMLYAGFVEVLCRTVYFRYGATPHLPIWPSGLLDLSAVGVAAVYGYYRVRDGRLVTALFWLLIFSGLWLALLSPAERYLASPSGYERIVASKQWVYIFMCQAALVVTGFVIVQGLQRAEWRKSAWPDKLDQLLTPPPEWPGFRYSLGIVGVGLLIMGCVLIASPWTFFPALIAGISMFAIANRKWEENFADLAIGLMTIAIISLAMIFRIEDNLSSADRYAQIFSRVLIGLGIMVWFWHWLAGFWRQQLDEGEAWTTAGRLIRPCQRVGFLIGATGCLVAMNLAFWPLLPYVDTLDDSTWRWAWGLAGHAMLVLGILSAALRTGKHTLAWLTLFAASFLISFFCVRVSGETGRLVTTDWPIALAIAAIPAILLGSLARRSNRWEPFADPLHLAGVLLLPVSAILGTSSAAHLTLPQWLPVVTFAVLAGVYLMAAFIPGPPTFAAVSVICGAVGLWHLREWLGWPSFSSFYTMGVLTGAAIILIGMIYKGTVSRSTNRVMTIAGGVVLALSVLLGIVLPT